MRIFFTSSIFAVFFTATAIVPIKAAHAAPPTAEIIDGTPVSETQYPYVARLTTGGELLCSGTLVGTKYILTAAHCFFDERNRRAVGDTDIVARLGGQEIGSVKVNIHPSYRSRSSACVEGETDAAVIELGAAPAGISPIPLVDTAPAIGSTVLLAGYGTQGQGSTGQDDTIPPVGTVNIGTTVIEGYGDNPPQQNSGSSYYYWTFNGGESNTASGDSGGPAFFDSGGTRFLSGITCGGDGNAEFGTLSFNTRADLVKAWVDSITGATPVDTAPSFPKIKNQNATVGKPFIVRVTPNGSQPITVSVSGLPPGLVFDGGATISGTPTTAGTYTAEVSAVNSTGTGSTSFKIVVSSFDTALSIQKVLLQFDYEAGSQDFLDIDGKISVGSKFKPAGKRVLVQIGRFQKKFRLTANGQSSGSGRSFFDLVGAFNGNAFKKNNVRFLLTFERVALFDELSTLGFPSSTNASEGQEISLPLSITINGVESSITTIITFQSRDARWRIKK